MSRPNSLTLPINISLLKQLLEKQNITLSALGSILDVSRQTLHNWMGNEAMPPKKLTVLAKALALSDECFESLLRVDTSSKDRPSVEYRTLRNIELTPELKTQVEETANFFFKLSLKYSPTFEQSFSSLSFHPDTPTAQVATALLGHLHLQSAQLSLSNVIRELSRLGISVLFHDLGDQFRSENGQAACATFRDQRAIIIDSHEAIEDVLWRIFHELAHFYCPIKEGTRKSVEIFCNEVASEMLCPSSFFLEHQKKIKEFYSTNIRLLPILVEKLTNYFNASFEGIILSLQKHQFLDELQRKYIWKICHNRKENRRRVKDIIYPSDAHDPFKFWKDAFTDSDRVNFLGLQQLAKADLIAGNMSYSLAAELFSTDSMTMQQLENYWKIEYEAQSDY